MDSALKEILKEERRRKENGKDREKNGKEHREKNGKEHRGKNERDRREKNGKENEHHTRNKNERNERKRQDSVSIERIERIEKIEVVDEDIKFMFVYEDKNGELFSNIDRINKEDGDIIKIFPVYVHGYNDNLTEEEVTYKDGILVASNQEESWLTIIDEYEILPFDISDIVVYNGTFFHCEKDLIEYLSQYGAEYLPVNI